jgi:hypothetical protein
MMNNLSKQQLEKRIKYLILFFIVALVLSGVTAFPIESELQIAMNHIDVFPLFVQTWLLKVNEGVVYVNSNYPFISYGTDWLAFAHVVIGVAFIGPLHDPVRNIWVVQFGMIACIMIFPLAFIAGSIRGIPFYWQLIDCSFGLFGFIPLYVCYKMIRKLEEME